jgi:uncharacterized delta-60 repeat protein
VLDHRPLGVNSGFPLLISSLEIGTRRAPCGRSRSRNTRATYIKFFMSTLRIKQTSHRILGEARSVGASLCIGVLALFGALLVHAAPGDRDATFGDGGLAAFSFPGFSAAVFATASTLQADGKLTIAGECSSETVRMNCALRITSTGILDSSFGDDGWLAIPQFGANGSVFNIAYQDDGRLLLGGFCLGSSGSGACVVRLQANGVIDTSFGVQGVVILSNAPWLLGASVVSIHSHSLPDGRIALGVSCVPTGLSERRFCAARLQSNGVLDTTFWVGGMVAVVPETSLGTAQVLRTAAIDAAGRWVMAGSCSGLPLVRAGFCAIRLLSNGARDVSFGNGGVFVLEVPENTVTVQGAMLNTDGGALLDGSCATAQGSPVKCFAALTPQGGLDEAFGTAGFAKIAANDRDAPVASTRMPNGSIVIANFCRSTTENSSDFCLRELRSDGTQGPGAMWLPDVRANSQVTRSVAVDAQGRIVVSGACKSTPGESNSDQFCAARYEGGPFANTMCSFDLDGDGLVTPRVDGLILLRASLGFSANAILQGVSFPAAAKRKVWGGGGANDLRQYLVAQCGMSIAPIAMMN